MTKQEAHRLEKLCDDLMTYYLKTECEVSMALTGRLKISFDNSYINVNRGDDVSIHYINYHGLYNDLQEYIDKILSCVTNNKEIFDNLVWSYEHRGELEG